MVAFTVVCLFGPFPSLQHVQGSTPTGLLESGSRPLTHSSLGFLFHFPLFEAHWIRERERVCVCVRVCQCLCVRVSVCVCVCLCVCARVRIMRAFVPCGRKTMRTRECVCVCARARVRIMRAFVPCGRKTIRITFNTCVHVSLNGKQLDRNPSLMSDRCSLVHC